MNVPFRHVKIKSMVNFYIYKINKMSKNVHVWATQWLSSSGLKTKFDPFIRKFWCKIFKIIKHQDSKIPPKGCPWGPSKGKLISKCLFGICTFFQKTNENNSTWGTKVVNSIFFRLFLGELKIPKRHFEINLPLGQRENSMIFRYRFCNSTLPLNFHEINICRVFLAWGKTSYNICY